MSSVKRNYLKRINRLLIVILALIGITGCADSEKYGVPYPAYGSPYAVLELSGTVTNQDQIPIKGIQISTKGEY